MKHVFEFLDDYMKEMFEERSAIIEYEGNQTRHEAERLAMEELNKVMESKGK